MDQVGKVTIVMKLIRLGSTSVLTCWMFSTIDSILKKQSQQIVQNTSIDAKTYSAIYKIGVVEIKNVLLRLQHTTIHFKMQPILTKKLVLGRQSHKFKRLMENSL